MARVTLIIGLASQIEIDCPVESREEADKVVESLTGDKLVKLPRASFAKIQGTAELGSKGVTFLMPGNVVYTQILGAEE
jgi:hypothetical protein